jgi:tRNA-2-methylthio-N6-dimethylallyladenosine synthase
MSRKYTSADFTDKARMFREMVPRISLTTDLIVGFPSETDKDFQHTLETVEHVAFDQAFSFKYSPRPGTAAADLPDDVPPDVKARRLETLQAALNRLEAQSLASLVGTTQEVLVEGPSQRDEQAASGRTRCNRVVNFTDPGTPPGTLVTVHIDEVRGHTLWASLDLPVVRG